MMTLAAAIELGGVVVIVWHCAIALLALARGRGVRAARLVVAEGAVAGLGFKVAATLLKTIALHSWPAIAAFACILALRTIVKSLFVWEAGELRAATVL